MKLEKVAVAIALQLEGLLTLRQSSWAGLANFVLHVHTNCYFWASDQNSDTTI